MQIIWTDYFKYRAKLRGFCLENLENVLQYSGERYIDSVTERAVVIGYDANIMVMIPHEESDLDEVTPITVHATNRQQINYRVRTGKFR